MGRGEEVSRAAILCIIPLHTSFAQDLCTYAAELRLCRSGEVSWVAGSDLGRSGGAHNIDEVVQRAPANPATHSGRGDADRAQRHTASLRQQRQTPLRTYTPKPGEVTRTWHVIDATDVVLGRLASQAAVLLRGKHKPQFAPHVDTGDFVIIINAEKVALTGAKLEQKKAYRHSGFPGGLRSTSYTELLAKSPEKAVEKAVKGMLPKNTLGRQMLSKLKVYKGDQHPHGAQQPQPYEITQVAQ